MERGVSFTRAILPIAGNGTRLKPITDHLPKVFIEVLGKPILAHILDNLKESSIDEVVLIVGHFEKEVIKWTRANYEEDFEFHFISQVDKLGLGHAIYTAQKFLDESEILIALGDEVFDGSYAKMIDGYKSMDGIAGAIGIKSVSDSASYGMVKVGPDNCIKHLVEKPKWFPDKTAIAGVYYFKNGYDLVPSLKAMMSNQDSGGEYQLTDALQHMISNGSTLLAFNVGEVYDCGRPETLIESNKRLVENNHHKNLNCEIINSEIIQPCYLGPMSVLVNSRVGPYVSIGPNVRIENSTISNAILQSNTSVRGISLQGAILSERGIISI